MRSSGTNPQLRELRGLVDAFGRFGFDLQRRPPPGENIFCSPLSIGVALAVMRLGARGRTADELASTLHVEGDAESLASALTRLRLGVAPREVPTWKRDSSGRGVEGTEEVFRLALATALSSETPFRSGRRSARSSESRSPWTSSRTRSPIPGLPPDGIAEEATRPKPFTLIDGRRRHR